MLCLFYLKIIFGNFSCPQVFNTCLASQKGLDVLISIFTSFSSEGDEIRYALAAVIAMLSFFKVSCSFIMVTISYICKTNHVLAFVSY